LYFQFLKQNLEKRSGLDRKQDDNFSDCTSISTKTDFDHEASLQYVGTNTNFDESKYSDGNQVSTPSPHTYTYTSNSTSTCTSTSTSTSFSANNSSSSSRDDHSLSSSSSFSSSQIAYYDEADRLLWYLVRFTSLALTTSKKEQRVSIMLSLSLHWATAILLCNSRPHEYSSVSLLSLLSRLSDLHVLNVPQLQRACNLKNLSPIFPKFSPAFEFIFNFPTPLIFAVSLIRVTQSPVSIKVVSILARAQPVTCFETDSSDNTPLAIISTSPPIVVSKGEEAPVSSTGFFAQDTNLSITSLLIQELTEIAPLTHLVANSQGLLPVHLVALNSSLDTFLGILSAAPNIVYAVASPSPSSPLSVRLAPNSSPFHFYLARTDQTWDSASISKIISLYPQYLGMVDSWGRTPLTVVIECGCTDSEVLACFSKSTKTSSAASSSSSSSSSSAYDESEY